MMGLILSSGLRAAFVLHIFENHDLSEVIDMAAAALPEILMTIGADASGAEAGLAEASAATESSTGKMKGLFDAAEKAIGNSMKEAAKHVAEAVGEMVSKFVDAGMGANAAAESASPRPERKRQISCAVAGRLLQEFQSVRVFRRASLPAGPKARGLLPDRASRTRT